MARQATRTKDAASIEWPADVRRASGRTPSRRARPQPTPQSLASQYQRHARGALSELAAAALLTLKGYRIIERRHRNRYGEIDLIAVRGRRIAFVEVKYRTTLAAAEASIADRQASRIGDAAEHWVWRHPEYHAHEIGLDAILVAGFSLPRHIANALQPA